MSFKIYTKLYKSFCNNENFFLKSWYVHILEGEHKISLKQGLLYGIQMGQERYLEQEQGVFISEWKNQATAFLQAEVYAIEECDQFNLHRRYKRQDIDIQIYRHAAIRTFGPYKAKWAEQGEAESAK